MSKALRCCVIGATGNWYRNIHHPSLVRLVDAGRVRLAAASSRSADGQKALREMGFGQVYADADEMLAAEQPDYVVLSMAVQPMAEMAIRVFDRKIPLFMEKPAGNNVATAERVRQAAERAGVPHLVAYNRRFNPLILRARELIAGRRVSQVMCDWLRNDTVAPSRLMGSSLHALDALRFLLGEVRDFCGVRAEIQYFDKKMVAASLALRFESGVVGSFTFNVRAGCSYECYSIFAENWTVSISQAAPGKFDETWWLKVEEDNRTVESITADDLTPEQRCGQYAHGFWREHEYFVECLNNGSKHLPDVADGIISMDLAQRMLKAVAPKGQVAKD